MEKPILSIIVPVYNSSLYIDRCITSLTSQTLTDIEIICIDDGSTDSSLQILNCFKEQDERIIVYSQKNSGVSAARNKGIDIAAGEYIAFVDSDDWVSIDAYRSLIDTAIMFNADMLIFGCTLEKENKCVVKLPFSEDRIIFSGNELDTLYRRHYGLTNTELAEPMLLDRLSSACLRIYRRNILIENSIRFIDIQLIGNFEDGLFNIDVMPCIKKAVYINIPFYHYWKSNTLSITSHWNPSLLKQRNILFSLLKKRIEEQHLSEEYEEAFSNRIALSLIGICLNEISAPFPFLHKIKRIKDILSSEQYNNALCNLDTKYCSIHWKVFFKLCTNKHYCLFSLLIEFMQFIRSRGLYYKKR